MKTKEDLISNLFKSCRVVIQGDFEPITGNQYQIVQNAAKMIIDAGLNTAVTCFDVDCSDIKSQINYEGVHNGEKHITKYSIKNENNEIEK